MLLSSITINLLSPQENRKDISKFQANIAQKYAYTHTNIHCSYFLVSLLISKYAFIQKFPNI